MTVIHKAKLFRNGASQAVRLPAEFRFDGEEVFISRDPTSGDVTLSTRPGALAWRKFFELGEAAGDAGDYMATRPLNTAPGERGVFDDE
ncbi:antitoxin [Sphingomonas solaris]|uniref:AbrB/MazE/SpoVT family DNA-binding domain-containing protein n=1 Tax=Alterirhizorhabdus solaris TaxID=2529389 RepID=A0A558R078_9SPHN|nr:AbrB/MazE/SpoVT family DNA-binding domain-containing protein [Sphingomonas solaris]TVV72759.1 AbrB/MazE/SpoVT family DNA-binding domain-containing protein [Sphingomonas solaris]